MSQLFQHMLKSYEAATERCMYLYAAGCYFDEKHYDFWYEGLADLANSMINSETDVRYRAWTEMKLYPALLLYYAAGMSCIWTKNYQSLYKLMHEVKIKPKYDDISMSLYKLHPRLVFDDVHKDGKYFNLQA